jgi:membrane protease YdiL (CAAX protease family)
MIGTGPAGKQFRSACKDFDGRLGILVGAAVCGPVCAFVALHIALVAGLPIPHAPASPAPLLLIRMLLVAPVLEELVFRGLLQDVLTASRSSKPRFGVARVGPLSLANVLTSAVFAASHLPYNPPLLACAVFLPSLVFGRLKELYGSLLPSIALHAWYNLAFLIIF